MSLKTLLLTTRPPFLLLTPVCVFLGVSTVIASGGTLNNGLLALVLVGALLAHISVNVLNEYFDFRSGLDLKTKSTPFSGGSKALPKQPEMVRFVLVLGILSLIATILIGLYLVMLIGIQLVIIGLIGILLVITYTSWLNKNPVLCLVAPGLGFGLMVIGTSLVLRGQIVTADWLAAGVVFFLVNNLLLLNQFPDITADSESGRRHLPIVMGTTISSFVYALFALAGMAIIIVGNTLGMFPKPALIALAPLLLAVFAFRGAEKYGILLGQHPEYLAANVVATLLIPLLLGLALLFASHG